MRFQTVMVSVTFFILIICKAICGANNLIVVDSEETDSPTPLEESTEHEKFVPTSEWQTIKPGQAIPAGLHVRINLQNGKKEAKLLEESNKGSKGNRISSTEEADKIGLSSRRFDPEELKQALKHLKNDGVTASEKAIKKKFRSIEELKKEFDTLNINVKTESEILAALIEKYKRGENKVPLLQDMEYLLHQYDLAQDFVKMGGIDLLLPDFNSTDKKIRSLVAFTLGSAVQGNPRVQISVLESNVLQLLLRLISFDESPEVQARALYALSCLLRNFPAAQKTFIQSGGVAALVELFKPQKMSPLKLQVKVITLLHDLLSEQHLTEKHVEKNDQIQQEKLRQYRSFDLETVLKQNGFCSLLPKLLGVPDHDTQEKVISAMQSLVSPCRDIFARCLGLLKNLAENYRLAALEEAEETKSDKSSFENNVDELYFLTLYSSATELISGVEQRHKDEL